MTTTTSYILTLEDAISALVADKSVLLEDCRTNLEALKDRIVTLLDTLEP